VSLIDVFVMIRSKFPSSFVGKASVDNVPFISAMSRFIQVVYVDRTNSKNREEVLEKITHRIK